MALSRDCKEKLLQTLTGRSNTITVASNCYIALLKAEPEYTTDGESTAPYLQYQEVNGIGYDRVLIGNGTAVVSQLMGKSDTNGTSSNVLNIMFPEAEADWGTVTHFALFNSKEGCEPHLWGALTTPVTISSGYVALFKPGSLSITLT